MQRTLDEAFKQKQQYLDENARLTSLLLDSENERDKCKEALKNLLDVFERCEAGIPPDIALRFLASDLAKAVLTTKT